MFAINTKVKVAAGIAAGVVTLGAAGAYAANAANTNSTITVTNPSPTALPSGGPTILSVDGKTLGTLPAFKNSGECISYFAKNRDWALAPKGTTSGSLTLSKNFHGKLISGLHQWCQTFNTNATTSQSAAPSTDSTDAADTTDSGSLPAAASHGQGHGHGHGHGLAD